MLPEITMVSTIVYCSWFPGNGKGKGDGGLSTRKSQDTSVTGHSPALGTDSSSEYPKGATRVAACWEWALLCQWSTVPQPSAVLSSLWISNLLCIDFGFYLRTSSTSEPSHTFASPSHPERIEIQSASESMQRTSPNLLPKSLQARGVNSLTVQKHWDFTAKAAQLQTVLLGSWEQFRFPGY